MKAVLRSWAVATLGLASFGAIASPTEDCRVDPSENFVTVGRFVRPSGDAKFEFKVSGLLRNGESVRYERDDAVLVADVVVSRRGTAYVPSEDVTVQQKGFLPLRLQMKGSGPLPVQQEMALPDGRVFALLDVNEHALLVAPDTGVICDAAISHRVSKAFWVKGLEQVPPSARLVQTPLGIVTDRASLRIVFTGISAGTINFQEVWVDKGRIKRSVPRSFDQFAKTVRIGLFQFEVVEAGRGSVSLRYDVKPEMEVSTAMLLAAGFNVGERKPLISIRSE